MMNNEEDFNLTAELGEQANMMSPTNMSPTGSQHEAEEDEEEYSDKEGDAHENDPDYNPVVSTQDQLNQRNSTELALGLVPVSPVTPHYAPAGGAGAGAGSSSRKRGRPSNPDKPHDPKTEYTACAKKHGEVEEKLEKYREVYQKSSTDFQQFIAGVKASYTHADPNISQVVQNDTAKYLHDALVCIFRLRTDTSGTEPVYNKISLSAVLKDISNVIKIPTAMSELNKEYDELTKELEEIQTEYLNAEMEKAKQEKMKKIKRHLEEAKGKRAKQIRSTRSKKVDDSDDE